uniref:Uncharacterized protein n=1 Tax=Desulfatirhabdium butyrativorans TaxID=340467 RepID=A0A7C4MMM6_9BACT
MDKIRIMEASVRKWEDIIAGKSSDGGVLDCPPCRIFYFFRCMGCPIANYTGHKFCVGSPYPDWYWHHIEAHDKVFRRIYCPTCLKYAEAMRDFMKEIVQDLRRKQESERKGRS